MTDEKPESLYPAHASLSVFAPLAAPEVWEEPAIGTPDVVDRLEASVRELRLALHEAQTDVRDLLALKTLAELAERQRAMWEEDALRYCRNEAYYRGLVVAIGEPFGVSAKTSDDGSLQQDVLCAKVPELVAALRAEVELLRYQTPQGWQRFKTRAEAAEAQVAKLANVLRRFTPGVCLAASEPANCGCAGCEARAALAPAPGGVLPPAPADDARTKDASGPDWDVFIGPCCHGRDPWTRCDDCAGKTPAQVMGAVIDEERGRARQVLGLLLEADKTTPSGSREEILIREAITLLGGTP